MAYSIKLCLPIQTPCFAPKTVRSKTLMLQQSQVQVKVNQVTVSQPQPIRYSTKKNTVRSFLLFVQKLVLIFLRIQTQPIWENLIFFLSKQVFEDPIQGIICYTDDNGEVICEGYDEGPRCPPESPIVTSFSR